MKEQQKWEPFKEMVRMQDQMNNLFHRFFGTEDVLGPVSNWTPVVDIAESSDAFHVKAEIPGMDPKDLEVSILGDILTLKGERKEEHESKDKTYHRVERYSGTFHRAIHLPSEVQSDQIKASYVQGVLTLDLPKKEEAKPKQIKLEIK